MKPVEGSSTYGYSAKYLQDNIGNLPALGPRQWYQDADGNFMPTYVDGVTTKVIDEFTVSKYFTNIPVDSDDCGKEDILTYGPHTRTYHACAITESNMKRALQKRVLYGGNKRLSSRDCYAKRMDAVEYLYKEFLPMLEPLPRTKTHEQMFYDYINNSKQINRKKREAYIAMWEAIHTATYEANLHAHDDPKGLRTINCFQKVENYEELKEPRAICACSTEHKVYFAPIINELQHHISKHYKFMVKTMTTEQIQQRKLEMAKQFSCFAGSDFSAFEGSQDYVWQCLIELAIFKHLLANYPELYDTFEWVVKNGHEIFYKKRHMCTLMGKRMSGDPHTSLGNSLTNYFVWCYTAYMSGAEFDIMVEGDDAFIASDKPLDIKFVEELGFDCKFQGPSSDPDDITFLSVYSVNGQKFGNIPKILDKLGVVKSQHFTDISKCVSKRKRKELIDYIYTKAYCYQVMYKGTPIVDPILTKMMEDFPGKFDPTMVDENWRQKIGEDTKIPNRQITDAVRERVAMIWPQFDITTQRRIEQEVLSCTKPCYIIDY